jgi:NAD(P)-dependent dehydrogenase (short-subunit alcohol dehydrogenase family)
LQSRTKIPAQVYIVTGGTAGIGFGISSHLLQHNAARIILVSQKEEHAEEAREALQKYGDVSRVHWVHCDLKDLTQTNETAKRLKSEQRIDGVRKSLSV